MSITLIGMGCGDGTLTCDALEELKRAEVVLGPERLLNTVPPDAKGKRIVCRVPEEMLSVLNSMEYGHASVLFSGDTGFYSGTRKLREQLEGMKIRTLHGISSLQMFSSRLGRAWQEWRICSAHGIECDPVYELCFGKPVFFLTGGRHGPADICREVCDAGLGMLHATVGERLGLPGETITAGDAASFSDREFDALNVLLIEAAPMPEIRNPGLPDNCFDRIDGVPMTKQEVRALIQAKLQIRETDLCWDIGAGTGSVGIELSYHAKAVWGIERNEEAFRLAKINRRKLCAWKLHLIKGTAPEILHELPKPDAVFIGGSGNAMEEILLEIRRIHAQTRICASAITLESLEAACKTLEK